MQKTFQQLKFILPIGGAIAFAGVAGFIYYKLFQKDEEIDDLSSSELNNIKEKNYTKLEIKIPKKTVGAVIGRQGANIKSIQETTSTSIQFRDDDENERTCIIKGKREKVERAKELILKAIDEIPVIKSLELRVPDHAIGRIIGRSGSEINAIQRASGAKIKVCSDDNFSDGSAEGSLCESTRKVLIKGTAEQVTAAKNSILEKVLEEEKMRKQIENSVSNISQRSKTRHPSGNIHPIEEVAPREGSLFLHPMSSKTFTEVFVSAVESATHFWVQVVGSKTIELDEMVTEMTDYYNDPMNRELHALDKIRTGDIVAAKFPVDGMWYRGRVSEPSGSNEDENEQHNIYFVDFGDSDAVLNADICELRTDFLKLSFQAIECYLANIDPESAQSEEASQTFEALTYATQWKAVMVRILSYKQEGPDTIPCVKVIDTSGSDDIDVATELVQKGLASWSEDKVTSPSSSLASLTENFANSVSDTQLLN